MKLLATETETCVIDRATLIAPTHVSLPCTNLPLNKNGTTLEHYWCVPGRGKTTSSPKPRRTPWKRNKIHATTYRFQEGDAADGTSCAPSDPCKITRHFPSSETQRSTVNKSIESAPT